MTDTVRIKCKAPQHHPKVAVVATFRRNPDAAVQWFGWEEVIPSTHDANLDFDRAVADELDADSEPTGRPIGEPQPAAERVRGKLLCRLCGSDVPYRMEHLAPLLDTAADNRVDLTLDLVADRV